MLFRATAIAAFVLAGALALAAGPAAAHTTTAVTCGQTLTKSVKLTKDLVNCPVDGLVIGADGITVDLNGHTVDGVVTQTGCPQGPPEPGAGILNHGAYDGVTIKDGVVQQFNNGVFGGSDTNGMSDSRVHHLTVRDNRFAGISLGSGGPASTTANNRIDHNSVSRTSCGAGIDINTGQDNRFTDNRVKDSGGIVVCCGETTDGNVVARNWVSGGEGFAILVFFSGNSRVVGNRLSDVAEGILISGASSNALVKDNAIVRAQGAGIVVESCCEDEPDLPVDVHVIGNTFAKVADGMILFETDRPVLRDNSVTGAGTFGDPEAFGVGIVLDGVNDGVVQHNLIAGGDGPGIAIGVPPEFNPSSRPPAGNVVAGNTVSGEGADGISVDVVAEDTTLRGNDANRNAGDGIHVMSATTTIARNTANRNADYGIEAVTGATDGGGNHARGNGNSAQCIGVMCN